MKMMRRLTVSLLALAACAGNALALSPSEGTDAGAIVERYRAEREGLSDAAAAEWLAKLEGAAVSTGDVKQRFVAALCAHELAAKMRNVDAARSVTKAVIDDPASSEADRAAIRFQQIRLLTERAEREWGGWKQNERSAATAEIAGYVSDLQRCKGLVTSVAVEPTQSAGVRAGLVRDVIARLGILEGHEGDWLAAAKTHAVAGEFADWAMDQYGKVMQSALHADDDFARQASALVHLGRAGEAADAIDRGALARSPRKSPVFQCAVVLMATDGLPTESSAAFHWEMTKRVLAKHEWDSSTPELVVRAGVSMTMAKSGVDAAALADLQTWIETLRTEKRELVEISDRDAKASRVGRGAKVDQLAGEHELSSERLLGLSATCNRLLGRMDAARSNAAQYIQQYPRGYAYIAMQKIVDAPSISSTK